MTRLLKEEEFSGMTWIQLARHYKMKELDFIAAVFPTRMVVMGTMYEHYKEWHVKNYNKLAQALK